MCNPPRQTSNGTYRRIYCGHCNPLFRSIPFALRRLRCEWSTSPVYGGALSRNSSLDNAQSCNPDSFQLDLLIGLKSNSCTAQSSHWPTWLSLHCIGSATEKRRGKRRNRVTTVVIKVAIYSVQVLFCEHSRRNALAYVLQRKWKPANGKRDPFVYVYFTESYTYLQVDSALMLDVS